MPFGHGKNTNVYINGYDLTAFLNSFEASGTADTAETTTFSKNSKTYVPGNKDATLQAEGFFDGGADAVDEVLSTALAASANANIVYFPQGDAAGKYGYGFSTIETSYAVQSTVDDACKIVLAAQSVVGLERVVSLHALGAEADSDWTGSVVDNGAVTTNGGSAYLQVIASTGIIEVKVQHSADNLIWGDLASFTAVTGRTSERVTFSGTVNRYVRGTATIASGESITFNLSIHRA